MSRWSKSGTGFVVGTLPEKKVKRYRRPSRTPREKKLYQIFKGAAEMERRIVEGYGGRRPRPHLVGKVTKVIHLLIIAGLKLKSLNPDDYYGDLP